MVITSREHRYTHLSPYWEPALDLDIITYDQVLKRQTPHQATHIFTDLDRLPAWRVHEAAMLYRDLERRQLSALNDPSRFLGRFGLLRALFRAGFNDFNAYRLDELERPARWPVFLRLEGNHSAPVSDLIRNEEDLELAIQHAIEGGAPRSALLIIEFAAEPAAPGIFRKLSVFRVGARLIGYTCVHDDNWLVKYGKSGIATDELYEEEYSFVAHNPFAPLMSRAFDVAGLDYGRVDFGLVGGKPQVYEINSNPDLDLRPKPAANRRRNESIALFRERYIDAMNAIDVARRPSWRRTSSAVARKARLMPARIAKAVAAIAGVNSGIKASRH
ncbi:MAG TPA: hypothetical protein VJ846_01920 [Sphingomicrobium sp.]|nr:hypothetical protein [Sphingomicrobium sp.]